MTDQLKDLSDAATGGVWGQYHGSNGPWQDQANKGKYTDWDSSHCMSAMNERGRYPIGQFKHADTAAFVEALVNAYRAGELVPASELNETRGEALTWRKVDKIRAKQAAKPTGSALPQEWSPTTPDPVAEAAKVLLAYLPNYAMERAALESKARDDEGEFSSLSDLLDFSGQNKSYTAIREALSAALRALTKATACRKCGGAMSPGKALDQTLTGVGDFHDADDVSTISPGGPGALIDCMKCSECGWSVTKDGEVG